MDKLAHGFRITAGGRMRNGAIGRSISAGLLLLAPFVLFGLLVPPTPETPYSDDFDYAATAWHLADTGVLRMSDWPTTMLASHACWGALFCKLGGDSYLMLRLSMFALSAMTSIVLYVWARRLGHSRAFATWCGITFAVNPLTVSMQYSFMTDITGAALACLLVSLGRDLPTQNRPGPALRFGALSGIAYLARQTAAIPYVLVVALTLLQLVRRKGTFQQLVCLLAPFLLLVFGFRTWLAVSHGVPAHHAFQFLELKRPIEHVERAITLLFGLGLQLAPLAAFSWPSRSKKLWIGIGVAGVALSSASLLMSKSWPTLYQGDIFDLGLHAIEFPAGEIPAQLVGPAWTVGGREISVLRTVLMPVATLSLLILVPMWIPRRLPRGSSWLDRIPSLATLSFLANTGLLLITWVYADRYLLPMIPFSLMILAERVSPERTSRASTLGIAWAITLAMGGCSLVGIQDGMQRTETFWETARLLHALGVKPEQVDAGLAYGGHFRYSPTYRGPKHVGPYLDRLTPRERQFVMASYSPLTIAANRPVAITFGDQENCRVIGRRPFRSWFRSGDVRVLLRNGTSDAELPPAFREWAAEQKPSGPP